jgi:hypothetical protein
VFPAWTTAAAVSSHEVSIPKISTADITLRSFLKQGLSVYLPSIYGSTDGGNELEKKSETTRVLLIRLKKSSFYFLVVRNKEMDGGILFRLPTAKNSFRLKLTDFILL